MLDSSSLSTSSRTKSRFIALGAVGLVAVVCTICVLNINTPAPHLLSLISAEETEFNEFILTYGRQYSSEAEHLKRFKIFQENLAYIRVFNSMGNTVVLGVNDFSDLSPAEFKSMYLSPKPLPLNEEDEEGEDFAGISVPAQVDWRTQNAVTPVKNQGQCGSCWAFSATGSMESAWFLAGHTLVSLSEQQLVDCSRAYGNQGCNGGFYRQAYSYVIANKGITSEANYPYTAKDGACNKSKAVQYSASISSQVKVSANNPTALQAAVATKPTSVSVEADQSVWQNYKSGTITNNCGTNLDHDVMAVGYDTTGSTPFWIVKNSWGTSWGMSGYLQIAITSGAGVCGINMTPGYPIV